MITVETSQKALEAEIEALSASSEPWVPGALLALRWVLEGATKPSDLLPVDAA